MPDDTPLRPRQIAPFVAGDTERTAMSAGAMNEIVAALNAILKMQIVHGDIDQVVISDSNVILQIGDQVDPTSEPPPPPPPVTVIVKRMRYTGQDDNSIQVIPIGATFPVTNAAKPVCLRKITSETIDGVGISYSSYNWSTQKRLATGTIGGAPYSEWQMLTPPWQLFSEIIIVSCADTGVLVGGVDVGWVAHADGRAWAWENPQPP